MFSCVYSILELSRNFYGYLFFSLPSGNIQTCFWVSNVLQFLPDSQHCWHVRAIATTTLCRCGHQTFETIASKLSSPVCPWCNERIMIGRNVFGITRRSSMYIKSRSSRLRDRKFSRHGVGKRFIFVLCAIRFRTGPQTGSCPGFVILRSDWSGSRLAFWLAVCSPFVNFLR